MFSFLNRLSLHKLVVATGAPAAVRPVIENLQQGLPELLLACVVEVPTGNVLAYYTTQASYSPHHISLRYARLLSRLQQAQADQPWLTGPLTDLTLVLDEQLHHLRPLRGGQWYGFVAVRSADANLALTKEVMRRSAASA